MKTGCLFGVSPVPPLGHGDAAVSFLRSQYLGEHGGFVRLVSLWQAKGSDLNLFVAAEQKGSLLLAAACLL